NWYGSEYLKASRKIIVLKQMNIAIDRFHQSNHKRHMCKPEMRADDSRGMDGVGTKKRQWAWAHGLGTRKKFHGLGLTGSGQVAEKCCP
ncbi:unnamed protein product, partial [Didymodactylos carnosus]